MYAKSLFLSLHKKSLWLLNQLLPSCHRLSWWISTVINSKQYLPKKRLHNILRHFYCCYYCCWWWCVAWSGDTNARSEGIFFFTLACQNFYYNVIWKVIKIRKAPGAQRWWEKLPVPFPQQRGFLETDRETLLFLKPTWWFGIRAKDMEEKLNQILISNAEVGWNKILLQLSFIASNKYFLLGNFCCFVFVGSKLNNPVFPIKNWMAGWSLRSSLGVSFSALPAYPWGRKWDPPCDIKHSFTNNGWLLQASDVCGLCLSFLCVVVTSLWS